jgi:hypothetical protein
MDKLSLLGIHINDEEARKLYLQKIEEHVKKYDAELTLWDSKELCRQTCMSWSTIQREFLYDKRFPKYKVGNKWRFPAKESKQFILTWIREQKTR